MQNVKNLNPVVYLDGDAQRRTVVAGNPIMALWHTMIGKGHLDNSLMLVTALNPHIGLDMRRRQRSH